MGAGQYHINLETGEPGKCEASIKACPHGGDELHFTSMEAARQAFEIIAAAEKAKSLQAWKKKKPRSAAKSNNPYAADPPASGHGVGRGHGMWAPPANKNIHPSSPSVKGSSTAPPADGFYPASSGHGGHGR